MVNHIFDKKSKGSYTIEAVIVMSSILMTIFALFYSFMLMYENVVIMYAASYGAQQGAAAWVNTGREIDGSSISYKSEEIYGRLIDSKEDEKKSKIEDAVLSKLKRGIFSAERDDIEVKIKGILPKKITVTVKIDAPIPFAGIVAYFSGEEFALKSTASATVADPTEYIRNIDYGIELVEKVIDTVGNMMGAIDLWGNSEEE